MSIRTSSCEMFGCSITMIGDATQQLFDVKWNYWIMVFKGLTVGLGFRCT